jgi:hypothetical protein
MDIGLKTIERDTTIQCRASIDVATVNEYAERMTEGDDFPPIVLFATNGKHWVGDGWHRLWAAEHIGALTIPAEVRKGGRVEALKHALGANAAHGHRRTNADKRRCVEIALREFPKLSAREVAKLCGVADSFVGDQRRQVQSDCTSRVTGADGKQYPAKRNQIRAPISVGTIGDVVEANPARLSELLRARASLQAEHDAVPFNRGIDSDRYWIGVRIVLSELLVRLRGPLPNQEPPRGVLESISELVRALEIVLCNYMEKK